MSNLIQGNDFDICLSEDKNPIFTITFHACCQYSTINKIAASLQPMLRRYQSCKIIFDFRKISPKLMNSAPCDLTPLAKGFKSLNICMRCVFVSGFSTARHNYLTDQAVKIEEKVSHLHIITMPKLPTTNYWLEQGCSANCPISARPIFPTETY
ncbi:hypothetical protein [Persicobacter psychrovividus]|uniref:Uncharacterized protein n=1 Tax=Persicobacter psychrovividus TaxID=387638 RepID=A0ABN6L4Y6_9BACT|nr:hypothetical protein PEPS_04090 [Persicobacter psychrovividus]